MMIEMKERMTCLNSILADREAPFTLEYCQRWKNNCMLEAYQLVNPKKNCTITYYRAKKPAPKRIDAGPPAKFF